MTATTEKFSVKLIGSNYYDLVFEAKTKEEGIDYIKNNILNIDGDDYQRLHYSDLKDLEVYLDREVFDEDGEVIEEEFIFRETIFDYTSDKKHYFSVKHNECISTEW